MLLAGSVTQAAAQVNRQENQSVTMSLFGVAPAPSNPILGMRPETVGAVAYFSLTTEAAASFRSASSAPQRLQIALPAGQSVTCAFRSQLRDGMLVLRGEPVGGEPGDRCDLVIDNGRITGDLNIASGRYRIVPLGSDNTHAVVEVRIDALPNERSPKRRS